MTNFTLDINGISIESNQILQSIQEQGHKKAIMLLVRQTNCTRFEAEEIVNDIWHMHKLQNQKLREFSEVKNEIRQQKIKEAQILKENRLQREAQERIQQEKNNTPLICPKCHSHHISTGAKGFSIFTGWLFSGDTVNRCGNCGHTWRPSGK